MSILLLKHNYQASLVARSAQITVTLQGIVSKDALAVVDAALEHIAERFSALRGALPCMRIEGGFWTFTSSCNAQFHSTILLDGFLSPLHAFGYETVNGHGDQLVAVFGRSGDCIVMRHKDTLEDFRPFADQQFGGNGSMFEVQKQGSVDIRANTRFNLSDMSLAVLGAGWDPIRNKTFQMIQGTGNPDLDLNMHLINRFGELMDVISPKGRRKIKGLHMGFDSKHGVAEGDDERAAVSLYGLHPAIKAILVTVQIASNARSFQQIRNTYLRLLDCQHSEQEVEQWRFRLDPDRIRDYEKTAVMARFEQAPDGGPWQLVTVGETVPQANPVRKVISLGDTMTAIEHGEIGMKRRDITSDGFTTNCKRISDAPLPVTLTFTHGAAVRDANACRPEPGTPQPGESYDVTFYVDPTSIIRFAPGAGEGLIVAHINYDRYYASGAVAPYQAPLNPYVGAQFADKARPKFVQISGVRARIPAADRGGTTDPYLRIFYRTLNIGAKSAIKDYKKHDIFKSKVQTKVRCPAWVDFQDVSVKIPIQSTVGLMHKCVVSVYDKDKMSRDDCLLEHIIDLTWCFGSADREAYQVHPTTANVSPEIENLPANQGFTAAMVTLGYTIQLLWE